MPQWILKPWVLMAFGAALLAAMFGAITWYGHAQYEAGRAIERAAALAAQQAVQAAMQLEKDRADAKYRGAVLARKLEQDQVAELRGQIAAAAARIAGLDGLLQQYRNRPPVARTSGGSDAVGPDWIGVFGECIGRVESLSGRLEAVGNDAARWADQLTGLQGYVRALQSGQKQ